MSKISRFSFVLLLISFALTVGATVVPSDSIQQSNVQGVQFVDKAAAEIARAFGNRKIALWSGASVSLDLAGAFLANVASYGQYEGAFRLNLKNQYFPILEMGVGTANHTDETTLLHYQTRSPYLRLGMDYNVKKDRRSKNRVFVGGRYGFSRFEYDLNGADLIDPYWKTTTPFQYPNLKGNAHWGELVFGLEAQIWKFVHLGWSVRHRRRLYEKQSPLGRAWYIPGYGRNGSSSSNWGGTFNLTFDISPTHKK